MSSNDSLPTRLLYRVVRVFLLVIVLKCCGQDGADDGPRAVFPEPGLYDSATVCEWVFDANWEYEHSFSSWFYPALYVSNIQCLFFFEAGENEVVEVSFNHQRFCIEPSEGCKYDYLEIRDGRYGFSPLISRICGDTSPGNITSSGRYLWILFVTDEDLEYTGFEAHYRFIPAPSNTTPPIQEECFFHLHGAYDGVFSIKQGTDLLRKEDKHAHMDCTWQIDTPEVSKIKIEFLKFEMNNKNDCSKNSVMIYDKYSTEEWMIREYCSTTAPAAMTISNRMFVRFIASNYSDSNKVEMAYTAYSDRPCDRESFPCGPFMCLNRTLVCNGRRNCWNYAFDEEPEMCEAEETSSLFNGRVDVMLAVTMGIILTVTVITIIVTCRHSCLRTREKAKTMASQRKQLNQQVQILMDGDEAESHEMNSLGDKYNTKYSKYPASRTSSGTSGAGVNRPRSCSHDYPMTAAQLKEYERIMDSELGFEPRHQRTSYGEPDSPWVRANQYNESFRRSSTQPHYPNTQTCF